MNITSDLSSQNLAVLNIFTAAISADEHEYILADTKEQ